VEKSLESVRNAEKATKPGEWFSSGERWLPALGKTPKGQKTAREAVVTAISERKALRRR
jgi:hypothetical protein